MSTPSKLPSLDVLLSSAGLGGASKSQHCATLTSKNVDVARLLELSDAELTELGRDVLKLSLDERHLLRAELDKLRPASTPTSPQANSFQAKKRRQASFMGFPTSSSSSSSSNTTTTTVPLSTGSASDKEPMSFSSRIASQLSFSALTRGRSIARRASENKLLEPMNPSPSSAAAAITPRASSEATPIRASTESVMSEDSDSSTSSNGSKSSKRSRALTVGTTSLLAKALKPSASIVKRPELSKVVAPPPPKVETIRTTTPPTPLEPATPTTPMSSKSSKNGSRTIGHSRSEKLIALVAEDDGTPPPAMSMTPESKRRSSKKHPRKELSLRFDKATYTPILNQNATVRSTLVSILNGHATNFEKSLSMAAVLARDVHGLAADLERVKVCRENAVLLGGRLVQLLQPLEGLVQQPGAIIELGLSTTLHDFFPIVEAATVKASMLLQEYTTAGFLMRMFSSPSDGKRFAELDRGIVRAMVEFSGILEDSKPKATSPSTKTLLTDLSESLQQGLVDVRAYINTEQIVGEECFKMGLEVTLDTLIDKLRLRRLAEVIGIPAPELIEELPNALDNVQTVLVNVAARKGTGPHSLFDTTKWRLFWKTQLHNREWVKLSELLQGFSEQTSSALTDKLLVEFQHVLVSIFVSFSPTDLPSNAAATAAAAAHSLTSQRSSGNLSASSTSNSKAPAVKLDESFVHVSTVALFASAIKDRRVSSASASSGIRKSTSLDAFAGIEDDERVGDEIVNMLKQWATLVPSNNGGSTPSSSSSSSSSSSLKGSLDYHVVRRAMIAQSLPQRLLTPHDTLSASSNATQVRTDAASAIIVHLATYPLVWLHGETGSGKSTVAAAAARKAALGGAMDMVYCVEAAGLSDDALQHKVARSVFRTRVNPSTANLAETLRLWASTLTHPTLLVIDNLDISVPIIDPIARTRSPPIGSTVSYGSSNNLSQLLGSPLEDPARQQLAWLRDLVAAAALGAHLAVLVTSRQPLPQGVIPSAVGLPLKPLSEADAQQVQDGCLPKLSPAVPPAKKGDTSLQQPGRIWSRFVGHRLALQGNIRTALHNDVSEELAITMLSALSCGVNNSPTGTTTTTASTSSSSAAATEPSSPLSPALSIGRSVPFDEDVALRMIQAFEGQEGICDEPARAILRALVSLGYLDVDVSTSRPTYWLRHTTTLIGNGPANTALPSSSSAETMVTSPSSASHASHSPQSPELLLPQRAYCNVAIHVLARAVQCFQQGQVVLALQLIDGKRAIIDRLFHYISSVAVWPAWAPELVRGFYNAVWSGWALLVLRWPRAFLEPIVDKVGLFVAMADHPPANALGITEEERHQILAWSLSVSNPSKALHLLEAASLRDDRSQLLRAMSLNALGAIHLRSGQVKEALTNYTEALLIRRQLLGDNHADTAALYNNLGAIHQILGDLHRAQQHYHRSLTMRVDIFGLVHDDLAASHDNLGNVMTAQHEPMQTLEHHHRAMLIRLHLHGPYHAGTLTSLERTIRAHVALHEHDHAVLFSRRWLQANQTIHGEDHAATSKAYLTTAVELREARMDVIQANDYLQRAYRIRLKLYGPAHADTLEVTNTMQKYNVTPKAPVAH